MMSGATITDLSTGLMWMKGDSGESAGTLDWIEALDWCENLVHAGYDDWRLPNPKELHSLVDYTRAPGRRHAIPPCRPPWTHRGIPPNLDAQ